jgi:hypothetical protein
MVESMSAACRSVFKEQGSGIHLVEAVQGLVQADAQFDLPAHAVEVSELPGAGAGRQIRQEKTGRLGGVAPDETKG